MINLLGGVKDFFKKQEMVIDHPIFRIHCTFSSVLFLIFSMVIFWTQFVGQPIKCITDGVPAPVINKYCWISGTFTLPPAAFQRRDGVGHPGVGQNPDGNEDNQKYYTFYPYVSFILFFQALLCYFPKFLWETWEHELMSTIVCGLNIGLQSDEDKTKKTSNLIDYLIRHLNQHNKYAFQYWFCEFLCLVNVLFQMFFMNWYFKGDFVKFGLGVLTFDDWDQANREDHLALVFPRVTKCTFRLYGPTQTIETRDAICILPLNIVNEKTYIFLWFWFIGMAVLCSIIILYRLVVILCPVIRPRLMHGRNRMVPLKAVQFVSSKLGVGDWWVLYMLARNVDAWLYRDVIVEFSRKSEILALENESEENLKNK